MQKHSMSFCTSEVHNHFGPRAAAYYFYLTRGPMSNLPLNMPYEIMAVKILIVNFASIVIGSCSCGDLYGSTCLGWTQFCADPLYTTFMTTNCAKTCKYVRGHNIICALY